MSHPYLNRVIDLVRAAGQAILPHWRNDVQVQEKADASPVTAADLAAHHLLLAGLQALDPAIPVLSEEACDLDLAQRAGWTRWWLVDPLDGTKEFIAGSEEFTVNVALIEDGCVRFGVVGVPANGRCYYGGAGFGELVLASVGSSLKFCLLAEGAADCYPRLAPTSQWDTAAAQGVLEGAGGEVLDCLGVPLRYDARASYLNPSFLALPRGAAWRADLIELANHAPQA